MKMNCFKLVNAFLHLHSFVKKNIDHVERKLFYLVDCLFILFLLNTPEKCLYIAIAVFYEGMATVKTL